MNNSITQFTEKAKEDVLELKKEALYVSYPQYIGGFLGFFLVVLLFSYVIYSCYIIALFSSLSRKR